MKYILIFLLSFQYVFAQNITLNLQGGSTGGPANTIYTSDGTIGANRAIALNGKTVNISQGGNYFLYIDPTTNTEVSALRAINITGSDNTARVGMGTTATESSSTIESIFNGGAKLASVAAVANTSTSTLTYNADSHGFQGGTIENYLGKYNNQTGTSYTLLASDAGKIVTLSNGSAITLTVPSGLPIGFNCTIVQLGAGVVTITASGTTINNRQSFTQTAGQYAVASIISRSSNNFITGGDMQ